MSKYKYANHKSEGLCSMKKEFLVISSGTFSYSKKIFAETEKEAHDLGLQEMHQTEHFDLEQSNFEVYQ